MSRMKGTQMGVIERIKCGNGNAYLVTDGDSAILVDTCREQYRDLILEKCKVKNVRLIILTHGHIDHIQNSAFFSKKLNAPIAMHEADMELTRSNWSEPMYAHTILGRIIIRLSQQSFEHDKIEPFEPLLFLKESDSLAEYGVDATVIELPGHTKGSIGIMVGDTDIIVGDALMNMPFPSKSPLYGNRAAMEKSAAKISASGGAMIHFGHGKPVRNRDW